MRHYPWSLFVLCLFVSCSNSKQVTVTDTSAINSVSLPSFYFLDAHQFMLDVVYEEGAEPYVDLEGEDLWQIAEENVRAIFTGRSAHENIFIPRTHEEMTEIADQDKSSWSAQEILDFALEHRTAQNFGTSSTAFVGFVNGFFFDGENERSDVLGVTLMGYGIVMIFADALDVFNHISLGPTSVPSPNLRKVVEQTTLVHELGHVFGLVNFGLPLTSEHHDEENGAHCTNTNCVMYHENEGLESINQFVQHTLAGDSYVIFGEECLNDALQFYIQHAHESSSRGS